MSARWVVIQRNPTSGSGRYRGEILQLVSRLKQHGFQPRLFSSRERLTHFLNRSESRDQIRCVVAAGGDGTVCDVVNRCAGLPVAVLPLGTENLIARYLGQPRDGRKLADVIAAGYSRRFDACSLNGRRFLIMAGFGFDAEVVRRTHARRRGNISRLTYARPIWESLRQYRHPSMRFWIDDEQEPIPAGFAVLVNLPVYALGLKVAGSAAPDDGFLDLRLFRRSSAFQMLRYLYKVKRGLHESLPDVLSFRIRRLRVESDEPVPVQVDGDPAGWTPATIAVVPASWEALLPESPTILRG